ncbi:hypothetical protein ACFL1S_05355, partial [Pseudomonadota bacterium]
MSLIFWYLYLLILPGFAVTLVVNAQRFRFLYSVTLSYALLLVLLVTGRVLGLGLDQLLLVLHGTIAVAVVAGTGMFVLRRPAGVAAAAITWTGPRGRRKARAVFPVFVVIVCVVLYFAVVGPYVELPADVYTHLERFQWASRYLDAGYLPPIGQPDEVFRKAARHWYLIYVLLCELSGTSIENAELAEEHVDQIPVASG